MFVCDFRLDRGRQRQVHNRIEAAAKHRRILRGELLVAAF
jgi:hypothetical protein